jgi:hypothetical protein
MPCFFRTYPYMAIYQSEVLTKDTDFVRAVFDQYGIVGLIVVAVILAGWIFLRYSSVFIGKKDEKKQKDQSIEEALMKINGLLDQVVRETEKSNERVKESSQEIKRELGIILSEVTKTTGDIGKEVGFISKDVSEIKTMVRETQRDMGRK